MFEINTIKKIICSSYNFEEYGIDSYLVHTGYTYHDGDELHIVIKSEGDRIKITDEGHTLMWLSYEEYNMTPSRKDQYQRILSENNTLDDRGRIYVIYDDIKETSAYLKSIIQTLLQVADLCSMTSVVCRPNLRMRLTLLHADFDERRYSRLRRHKVLCKIDAISAPHRFEPKDTRMFRQQVKKMKGSGADMEALERAIQLLAVGDAMPPSYDDRPYMDENNANRSCHVGSGWRLYYSKSDGNLELRSVRHVGNLI